MCRGPLGTVSQFIPRREVGQGRRRFLPGRADSSVTLPQLINAWRTRQGLRTLLILVPPSLPGERRACRRVPGRPSRTRNRKRRPTAAYEKGGGPFGRGGPTGEDGSTGHLRFLPFPSTFSGWQLTGRWTWLGSYWTKKAPSPSLVSRTSR